MRIDGEGVVGGVYESGRVAVWLDVAHAMGANEAPTLALKTALWHGVG